MSQPPHQPRRDHWYRPDESYGQPGYDPEAERHERGQYPNAPRYGEPQGEYGRAAGTYGHAEQQYPGYGQGGSYGGYGQPAEPSYPDHGQSYGGYGPPADPAYPGGYGQGQPHGGYGQPAGQGYAGYGQPGTGTYGAATGHGYPGYSGGGDPVPSYDVPGGPRKKSRARKIALITVVAVLVLCGGGGFAAYTFFKDDAKEIAEAANTRLVAPDKLGNRPKIKDGQLQVLADKLVSDMKRDVPEAKDTIGAFYGNPANKDMVMIAGASGRVADPEKQLDQAIREMAAGGLKVTNVKAVEPGPLGGVAKCGDATADGVPMGVCAWSDRGSLGMIVIYFKNSKQAGAEFVAIRGAIEQRG
jgi:hypothetical protein